MSSSFRPIAQEKGELGWSLFDNLVLFLDLSNFRVAVCDSIDTFEDQECSLETFTKAPLLVDRHFLEIETTTSQGPLRCILSTGCTYNFFNKDIPNNESEENLVKFPMFLIGEKDFGAITFRPLHMKFPHHIDAVLGMDFFFKHRVILDLKNHQIYFSNPE